MSIYTWTKLNRKGGTIMKQKQIGNVKRMLCLILAVCCVMAGIEGSRLETQAATTSLSEMVKQLKAGNYKKATKIAKKHPKKANEKCVKNMSAKMKKAYKKKVKSYNANNSFLTPSKYIWDYYLTDFDNDGKAELLVQYGSCEADVQMIVYKYKNSQLKKLGAFSCFHESFYQYSNGILTYGAHMGNEWVARVYMKNGKIKKATVADHYADNGEDYVFVLPYALKSHEEYTSDYSSRWMNLDDLS